MKNGLTYSVIIAGNQEKELASNVITKHAVLVTMWDAQWEEVWLKNGTKWNNSKIQKMTPTCLFSVKDTKKLGTPNSKNVALRILSPYFLRSVERTT